jgi:hypothetical protein
MASLVLALILNRLGALPPLDGAFWGGALDGFSVILLALSIFLNVSETCAMARHDR